jgi:hypothetical protein
MAARPVSESRQSLAGLVAGRLAAVVGLSPFVLVGSRPPPPSRCPDREGGFGSHPRAIWIGGTFMGGVRRGVHGRGINRLGGVVTVESLE